MSWELAAVIGLIAVIFLLMFRRNIAGFIDRVKSVSREGVSTVDPAQQAEVPQRNPQAEAEVLMRTLDDPVLVDTERVIQEELGRRSLLGPEAVPLLIRFLARLAINNQFDQTYRVILGSQLRALNHLNGQTQPTDRTTIEMIYMEAASNHTQEYRNFDFDRWLGFLRGQALVIEDNNGRLQITVRGRSFLAYLVQNGYSQNLQY